MRGSCVGWLSGEVGSGLDQVCSLSDRGGRQVAQHSNTGFIPVLPDDLKGSMVKAGCRGSVHSDAFSLE